MQFAWPFERTLLLMDEPRLKFTLKRLHEELQTADRFDDELQALLSELDDDIHRLLDEERTASSWEKLQVRTKALAVRFEAGHPRAAKVFSELADSLGKMGV